MFYLVVVVVVVLCTVETVSSSECGFKGNICDADAQCMGEISNGAGCYNMFPEKLYKSSSPRNFSVFISDMSPYPEDVTLTVLRVHKNKYTTVPKCCNLKSNETCLLPPSDGAKYVIVAPVLEKEIHFYIPPPFCSFDVFVDDKKILKWCFVDETAPCKNVKGDMVYVKEPYREVSTESWEKNLTYDICLFDAPIMKADGDTYFHEDGLSYGVKNVHKKPDEICNGKGEGKIIKNLNRGEYLKAFKERAPSGYTRCGFLKEKGYVSMPSWDTEPICHAHGTSDPFPVWSIVLVAIIAVAIFTFIFALVYRRYADSWFPEYKISLQLTEVLPAIAEKGKEEKIKKDKEIFAINGSKPLESGSTEERYTRTPVHSTKLAIQTRDGKLETIDTELTFLNDYAGDKVSVDVETTDVIEETSDFSEANTVTNVAANNAYTLQNVNFGYVSKQHDLEESSVKRENKKNSDFNANNLSPNIVNTNNSANSEVEDLVIENTASQPCSSRDSGGGENLANEKERKIVFDSPWKTKTIPSIQCVPSHFTCIEGDYVEKYNYDPV